MSSKAPLAPPLGTPASGRAPRRVVYMKHESQYHRLSRSPDRFAPPRSSGSQPGSSDLTPFATNFFKNNPGAQDLTAPEDKLAKMNDALGGDLPANEQFEVLTQKKAMVYLVHGEESKEMRECVCQLARFYNANDRPESAVRNYKAAKKIDESVEPTPEEDLRLSLDLAEAHLTVQTKPRQNAEAAGEEIARFDEDEVEPGDLALRLIIVRARVARLTDRLEDADAAYGKAVQGLEGRTDEEAGRVFTEAADVAHGRDDVDRARALYQKAKDIYDGDENSEVADLIAKKIEEIDSHRIDDD